MQLLAVGSPGSGLSLAGRLLEACGVRLVPEVSRLCDRLAGGAARPWRLPTVELDADMRRELEALDGAWAAVDPRLSLLFPALAPLLPRPAALVVYRHPLEVARALKAHRGLDLLAGLGLWERYNLAALEASGGVPRLFLSYDELCSPEGARALSRFLGLPEPRVIEPAARRSPAGDDAGLEALANPQQIALWHALRDGSAQEWEKVPALSAGAEEALSAAEATTRALEDSTVLRGALDKQHARLRWLEGTVATLEGHVRDLLASKRWKLGNAIGEALQRARRRPRSITPADLLERTLAAYRRPPAGVSLSPKPPPAPVRRGAAAALPKGTVDVIVCVHNAREDVERCLRSVEEKTRRPFRLIIVDDGSDAPTRDHVKAVAERGGHVLIRHESARGYTKAANAGLKAADADYMVLLNSDTIVTTGWIERLLECADSDPQIGVVGPLSNAASWQNVPELEDKERGGFAVNALPPGSTPDDVAALIHDSSRRIFPRVTFVNGFCFMVKRAALDAVGLLDEESFPDGYGEENDLCMRVAKAGFALAIADNAYVFHAKSKSYTHERRARLSRAGQVALEAKWGAHAFALEVDKTRSSLGLASARAAIASALGAPLKRASGPRVLFLMPVKTGAGGVHSVVQEVAGMRGLGVEAQVAVTQNDLPGFVQNYKNLPGARSLFCSTASEAELLAAAGDYDVVVGTIFFTMEQVRRIVERHPHVVPAYYVQDYEPEFFAPGTSEHTQAKASYELVPGAVLFAKTHYLCERVAAEHGLEVHKVSPSIDLELYRPGPKKERGGPVVVSAMVRPSSRRRAPERTLMVLRRLKQTLGPKVAIRVFGCEQHDLVAAGWPVDFELDCLGFLGREAVAESHRTADVFADLSDYQAFGRSAVEAMACGAAVVVPKEGGTAEFAVDGENALVVDTRSEEACYRALENLVLDAALRRRLAAAGQKSVQRFSIEAAARSELEVLKREWERRGARSGRRAAS